jgi:hypothetical protein
MVELLSNGDQVSRYPCRTKRGRQPSPPGTTLKGVKHFCTRRLGFWRGLRTEQLGGGVRGSKDPDPCRKERCARRQVSPKPLEVSEGVVLAVVDSWNCHKDQILVLVARQGRADVRSEG